MYAEIEDEEIRCQEIQDNWQRQVIEKAYSPQSSYDKKERGEGKAPSPGGGSG